MEEEEKETAENYCASCGSPIPPGAVTCARCSQLRHAEKRPVSSSSDEDAERVSVLRTPEESVRRGMSYGTLTEEEGELLLLLLSRGRLLDFSVRSVLKSLIREIAEERDAERRKERVYTLMELVEMTMPSENFSRELSCAFKIA